MVSDSHCWREKEHKDQNSKTLPEIFFIKGKSKINDTLRTMTVVKGIPKKENVQKILQNSLVMKNIMHYINMTEVIINSNAKMSKYNEDR